MGAVVSLDGFIAHDDDDVGPLFDWYGNGDVEWAFSDDREYPCRTTQASKDFMQAVYPRIGAVVIGRRLFDHTDGWGGVPATGDHVFVVTHKPPTGWKHAGGAAGGAVRAAPGDRLTSLGVRYGQTNRSSNAGQQRLPAQRPVGADRGVQQHHGRIPGCPVRGETCGSCRRSFRRAQPSARRRPLDACRPSRC